MDHTSTSTFDIPGLVRAFVGDLVPVQVGLDQVKPETPLHGAPLFLDEMDVMGLVQELSEDLDIAVTFDEEDLLNTSTATIQTAIDLFTRLHAAQHPTQQ